MENTNKEISILELAKSCSEMADTLTANDVLLMCGIMCMDAQQRPEQVRELLMYVNREIVSQENPTVAAICSLIDSVIFRGDDDEKTIRY